MNDWLHCNTCFAQPGNGKWYFITNCGHLFCNSCEERGWKEKCMVCGIPKPSILKLSSKLLPPMDAYFLDQLKMIKQLEETTKFQCQHRNMLMVHYQKKIAHQKLLVDKYEQDIKMVYTKYEELKREYSKQREEINYLKRLLSEKSHGVTPRGTPGPTGDRYRSPMSKGTPGVSPLQMHQGSRCNSHSSLMEIGQNSSSGGHSMMYRGSSGTPGERYKSPMSKAGTPGVSPLQMHQGSRCNSHSSLMDLGQTSSLGGHSMMCRGSSGTPGERYKSPLSKAGTPAVSPLQSSMSSSGRIMITSARISVRGPPSGGRMGTIPKFS